MTNTFQLFHLIVIAMASWVNRQQLVVIDYLIEENRILKEQRIRLANPTCCHRTICGSSTFHGNR